MHWFVERKGITIISLFLVLNSIFSVEAQPIEKEVNYLLEVKNNFSKYYPEEQSYFLEAFKQIDALSPEVLKVIREKLQLKCGKYIDQLPTEKEKVTMLLLFYEAGLGEDKFSTKMQTNKEKDIEQKLDLIYETLDEVSTHFEEENRKAKEEERRTKEELTQTVLKVEKSLEKVDPKAVKDLPKLQELLRWYQKVCSKDLPREMSPKAKQLIALLPENQK